MSEDRVEENQFRFQRFILFVEYCRILSFKEFSSYRFLNKFFSYNFISSDPTIRCLRQNCGLRVRIKSCIMQTKRIIDEPNHSKQLLSTCFNSMITGEGKKKKKNNIRALDREMNELYVAFTALSRDLRTCYT